MTAAPLNETLDQLVAEAARSGQLDAVLVASADGLVVAASSDDEAEVATAAAFVSLFLDAVDRAEQDLGFQTLDELAMLDGSRRRFVVRPLPDGLFLVARVPARVTWRRTTNQLRRKLIAAMDAADA